MRKVLADREKDIGKEMENKLDRQELMESLFGETDRFQKTDSESAAVPSSETAVEEIDITAIRDYGGNGRKHRFRLDLSKVEEIADSIDSIGKILTPCIVRRDPDGDAEYEMLSGHHRKEAAKKKGLQTLPCIVVNVKDDIEANAITAITNKQREKLTVMEQAYIYRYEYDLIKSQGREKENGKWSVDEIAENENSSGRTIQRLIKLTYLIEDLQQMIDAGSLSKKAGHELAALNKDEQKLIHGLQTEEDIKISTKQAAEIKKLSKEGLLTREAAILILSEGREKSDENTVSRKISISLPREYGKLFPPACSTKEKREKVMIWLLKNYRNEIYERFGEENE